jgi:hypothetical protein
MYCPVHGCISHFKYSLPSTLLMQPQVAVNNTSEQDDMYTNILTWYMADWWIAALPLTVLLVAGGWTHHDS